MGSAHKNLPIQQFIRSKQLECLRAETKFVKTGGSLVEKNLFIHCLMNGFFLLLSHLKANAVVFKPPNSELFGYR
ncbi:hypothetical protein [Ruminococcus sp.]